VLDNVNVIVSNDSTASLHQQALLSNKTELKIVSPKWIQDVHSNNKLIDPSFYEMFSDVGWNSSSSSDEIVSLMDDSQDTLELDDDDDDDTIELNISKTLVTKSSSVLRQCSLPSIFSQTHLFLCESVPNSDEIQRYVIAYDGKFVKNLNDAQLTHIICASGCCTQSNQNVKVVNPQWIYDTINHQSRQEEGGYRV